MSDNPPPADPPAPKPPRRRRTTPAKAAAPRVRTKVAVDEGGAVEPAPKPKRAPRAAPRRRAKAAAEAGVAPAKPKRARAKSAPEAQMGLGLAADAGNRADVAPEIASAEPAAPPVTAPQPEDLGLAHGESPADLPGTARIETGGLRWAASIFALSSPLLLLFNSHAIDNWARQLPVTNWSGPVIDAAIGWHGAMQRIGFAAPVDVGRAAWKRVKGEDAAAE